MYDSREEVREDRMTLRFSGPEAALIKRAVKKYGGHRAAVARERLIAALIQEFEQEEQKCANWTLNDLTLPEKLS
ncbi:MAG TPA: hypothetical protein DHU81_06595 [Hyphomonas sp.]|nr:hypothetical protein [Hyphomonas sp.]